jgi:hypothetical protein
VNIAKLKHLRYLEVTTRFDRDASWLLSILETIPSPNHIEEIHINFHVTHLKSHSWARLDTLLSGSNFPHLSVVKVDLMGREDLNPAEIHLVQQTTPRLCAKGIFSVHALTGQHTFPFQPKNS